MLNEILNYLNNYFQDNDYSYTIDCTFTGNDTIEGDFADTFLVGEYIRIRDTRLNDGVYLISAIDDTSITIDTTVDYIIRTEAEVSTRLVKADIPRDFISLVSDIETYNTNNTTAGATSESIDDYSVSYDSDTISGGWQGAFKGKLARFKKMRW